MSCVTGCFLWMSCLPFLGRRDNFWLDITLKKEGPFAKSSSLSTLDVNFPLRFLFPATNFKKTGGTNNPAGDDGIPKGLWPWQQPPSNHISSKLPYNFFIEFDPPPKKIWPNHNIYLTTLDSPEIAGVPFPLQLATFLGVFGRFARWLWSEKYPEQSCFNGWKRWFSILFPW